MTFPRTKLSNLGASSFPNPIPVVVVRGFFLPCEQVGQRAVVARPCWLPRASLSKARH